MGTEILRSQTGTGASKRIGSAVAALLSIAMILLRTMGQGDVSAEVEVQAPVISDAVSQAVEGGLMLTSAVLAIWSRYQAQGGKR